MGFENRDWEWGSENVTSERGLGVQTGNEAT